MIQIQPEAPAKPAWGAPCNGCGVCCLAEPCPLGMLLSGKRRGACAALVWNAGHAQYRCGAIQSPQQVVPPALRWLRRPLGWLLARTARRWIAAGAGCDSALEPQPLSATMATHSTHHQP